MKKGSAMNFPDITWGLVLAVLIIFCTIAFTLRNDGRQVGVMFSIVAFCMWLFTSNETFHSILLNNWIVIAIIVTGLVVLAQQMRKPTACPIVENDGLNTHRSHQPQQKPIPLQSRIIYIDVAQHEQQNDQTNDQPIELNDAMPHEDPQEHEEPLLEDEEPLLEDFPQLDDVEHVDEIPQLDDIEMPNNLTLIDDADGSFGIRQRHRSGRIFDNEDNN